MLTRISLFLATLLLATACDTVSLTKLGEPQPVKVSAEQLYSFEIHLLNSSVIVYATVNRVRAYSNEILLLDLDTQEKIAEKMALSSNASISPLGQDVIYFDLRHPETQSKYESIQVVMDVTSETGTIEKTVTYTVNQAPVTEFPSPVRGGEWVAANIGPKSIHRRAGVIKFESIPERFAIDFSKVEGEANFKNDGSQNEDHYAYGEALYAVANGTVVFVKNDMLDNVPANVIPTGLEMAEWGGNIVAIDIGGGKIAYYSHVKENSISVNVGDTVQVGDKIGEVGNTGQTTGVHLHFALLEDVDLSSPSLLDANSIPFHFTEFTRTRGLEQGLRLGEFPDQNFVDDASGVGYDFMNFPGE